MFSFLQAHFDSYISIFITISTVSFPHIKPHDTYIVLSKMNESVGDGGSPDDQHRAARRQASQRLGASGARTRPVLDQGVRLFDRPVTMVDSSNAKALFDSHSRYLPLLDVPVPSTSVPTTDHSTSAYSIFPNFDILSGIDHVPAITTSPLGDDSKYLVYPSYESYAYPSQASDAAQPSGSMSQISGTSEELDIEVTGSLSSFLANEGGLGESSTGRVAEVTAKLENLSFDSPVNSVSAASPTKSTDLSAAASINSQGDSGSGAVPSWVFDPVPTTARPAWLRDRPCTDGATGYRAKARAHFCVYAGCCEQPDEEGDDSSTLVEVDPDEALPLVEVDSNEAPPPAPSKLHWLDFGFLPQGKPAQARPTPRVQTHVTQATPSERVDRADGEKGDAWGRVEIQLSATSDDDWVKLEGPRAATAEHEELSGAVPAGDKEKGGRKGQRTASSAASMEQLVPETEGYVSIEPYKDTWSMGRLLHGKEGGC
ncbi:hypothetical protein F5B20DRAFT_519351 [Whalleya microplaca]|nr:hypothetical protein F5B20DRAFT_519351 [Whalleya microplaca]